ncbi:hypothetical protein A0256_23330 [Mucilaginibacter sp. PAMC 26640]|nr:hypothetical protein A0256_23330 [Mucilaginibacter sp. PAMC 26640]
MSYSDYLEEAIAHIAESSCNKSEAAHFIIGKYNLSNSHNAVRKAIGKLKGAKKIEPEAPQTIASKTPKSEPKPFVLSAWNDLTGRMMGINDYCEFYNLPFADVVSYKLISHTGTPYYNIFFKETQSGLPTVDYDAIRGVLDRELSKTYVPRIDNNTTYSHEAVLKWADLHFGAHIRNLLLTPDYDSSILKDGLMSSVTEVNSKGFKKVHVHILGDLIESLSGLNHINSWMSMNKDEIGANAIKLCCEALDIALRDVVNLGKVMIIGGNHDRLSKDNDEDVKGGAADLISWGLSLKGYDVEFHPYIICHEVEGIMHINLHGDKILSKRSTHDIIWKYGKKGMFNFIFEGHLHTIIEKMPTAQRDKFNIIKDDAVDHRRMYVPSFFTGNYYSETLGFNSNGGYVIVYDNGKGKPNILTAAL